MWGVVRGSARIGAGLSLKQMTSLSILVMCKHSSLFCLNLSDEKIGFKILTRGYCECWDGFGKIARSQRERERERERDMRRGE